MRTEIKKALLEVAFPENLYCISCGAPIKKKEKYSLCYKCRESILHKRPQTCPRCGSFVEGRFGMICVNCGAKEPEYDRGLACVVYSDRVKSMIYKYKYGGNTWMAEPISRIMDGAVGEVGNFDLIIPVPMFKSKQKVRGFCQTTLIAEKLGKMRGKEVVKGNLIRTRMTAPMSGLSPAERKTNIRGAFEVTDREFLKGKTVLLIDDLVTTGSTANACAKVLKSAGAEKVILAAFASPVLERFKEKQEKQRNNFTEY